MDQRLAVMRDALGGRMVPGYDVTLIQLTELEEGASDEERERWERCCDNCGTHVEQGTELQLGYLGRVFDGVPVIVTYGACSKCLGLES